MSRPLPPGLAAKITATGQTPELSVTVQDLQIRPTLFASGGTAGRSSALLSSSGKILKAICTQAAATNQTVKVQRITPTTASDWTAAGVTVTTNAIARAGCAIVQTGSTTRCFYQRTSDNLICYKDSTDGGLTWGAALSRFRHPRRALPNDRREPPPRAPILSMDSLLVPQASAFTRSAPTLRLGGSG